MDKLNFHDGEVKVQPSRVGKTVNDIIHQVEALESKPVFRFGRRQVVQ